MSADTGVPRPEYPRPQFVRTDWLCLNGEWQFEIDDGDSGLERGLPERELAQRITRALLPGIARCRASATPTSWPRSGTGAP